MNYIKRNINKGHTLIKTSVILATISPVIINSYSTKAMFKSSMKNPTSSKGGGVQSLISRFEGILGGKTSSTLTPPQNTKPKLLPKPLSVGEIKHPYGTEPSSPSKDLKISTTGGQSSTKPKVRFSPNVEVKTFDSNYGQATSTKPKTKPTISTKPKTKPPLPPKPQFNLKITNSPTPKQKPINISEKRMKDLEVLIKGNVAAVVKENLPKDFKLNNPITIKFDEASGQELSATLSKFIYKTTQNTLSSLSQKQK